MKIAIFQSELAVGGIERALINLLNVSELKQHDVDLYLFKENIFYEKILNSEINIIQLNKFIRLFHIIPFMVTKRIYSIKKLQRYWEKCNLEKEYDLAIDFNGYWPECALGSLTVNARKKVMWIHNDFKLKRLYNKKFRWLWWCEKRKFELFDEFVAVSKGAAESFLALTNFSNKKIRIIPNVLDVKSIINSSNVTMDFCVDNQKYNIVTMGRMIWTKGFDIVINEIKIAIEYRKNLHLYIIGDGPQRKHLERLANDLNIKQNVTFLGELANPFPYIKLMDGFAFASRYEGQGLVILEAKILGLRLFISDNLACYNEGIETCGNLASAFIVAEKCEKRIDHLVEYNAYVKKELINLFTTFY